MKVTRLAVVMTVQMTLCFCAGLGARAALNFEKCFTPEQPAGTYAPTKFADYNPREFASPMFELAQVDVVEPAPDLGEILEEGQSVASTWKELGVLAGLIALVTFLIRLTKLGFVGRAINRNRLDWIRPLLAMGAAGLTASAAALVLGQDLQWVILAGLVAGLAAPGVHELMGALQAVFSKEKREDLAGKAKERS